MLRWVFKPLEVMDVVWAEACGEPHARGMIQMTSARGRVGMMAWTRCMWSPFSFWSHRTDLTLCVTTGVRAATWTSYILTQAAPYVFPTRSGSQSQEIETVVGPTQHLNPISSRRYVAHNPPNCRSWFRPTRMGSFGSRGKIPLAVRSISC